MDASCPHSRPDRRSRPLRASLRPSSGEETRASGRAPSFPVIHEKADQARPHIWRPRLINRYAGTRKPIRLAACPTGEAWALPSSVCWCAFGGRLFRRRLLACRLLRPCPSRGGLLRGGLLDCAFARRLLRDHLAGGFLCRLLGGGLLRRLLGSSFRHLSRPSQSPAISADFRATQMQARKYIRFDSTQELRSARDEREARVTIELSRAHRAPDRSLTRRLAQHAWSRHNPNAWSASPAHGAALICMRIPALLIFSAYLQGSETSRARASSRMRETISSVPGAREAKRLRSCKRIKSKRRACCSQSNFSSSPLSHFCRLSVANARLGARIALRTQVIRRD